MIVWGGTRGSGSATNTGAGYDPDNDSWTPTADHDAPPARNNHVSVWTGSEMIVSGSGTIGPSTVQYVAAGASMAFQLHPDEGHEVTSLGGTCPGSLDGNVFLAGPINEDCTLEAVFRSVGAVEDRLFSDRFQP